MLTFLIGLLVGAIFGVIADRCWRKVEERIRIDIVPVQFTSSEGIGVGFKITNKGKTPIPPYQIAVGRLYKINVRPFESNHNGEQLPHQTMEHKFIVGYSIVPNDYLDFLFIDDPNLTYDFSFMLIQSNSECLLFESSKIGNAFARLYKAIRQQGDFKNVNTEDWNQLAYRVPWWHFGFARKMLKKTTNRVVSFDISPDNLPTQDKPIKLKL